MSKGEITRKVNMMNEIFATSKWVAHALENEDIAMEKQAEYSLGLGQTAKVDMKLIVDVKRTKDGLGKTVVKYVRAKYEFISSNKRKRELCKKWETNVASSIEFESFEEMTKEIMCVERCIADVMKNTALMTWMRAGSFKVKFGGMSISCRIKPNTKK